MNIDKIIKNVMTKHVSISFKIKSKSSKTKITIVANFDCTARSNIILQVLSCYEPVGKSTHLHMYEY